VTLFLKSAHGCVPKDAIDLENSRDGLLVLVATMVLSLSDAFICVPSLYASTLLLSSLLHACSFLLT